MGGFLLLNLLKLFTENKNNHLIKDNIYKDYLENINRKNFEKRFNHICIIIADFFLSYLLNIMLIVDYNKNIGPELIVFTRNNSLFIYDNVKHVNYSNLVFTIYEFDREYGFKNIGDSPTMAC